MQNSGEFRRENASACMRNTLSQRQCRAARKLNSLTTRPRDGRHDMNRCCTRSSAAVQPAPAKLGSSTSPMHEKEQGHETTQFFHVRSRLRRRSNRSCRGCRSRTSRADATCDRRGRAPASECSAGHRLQRPSPSRQTGRSELGPSLARAWRLAPPPLGLASSSLGLASSLELASPPLAPPSATLVGVMLNCEPRLR
jgi:hypothetical protein